ncbi:unnamed protein product [Closterium sp. NIES-54]
MPEAPFRCPALLAQCRAALQLLALPASRTSCPAAACESRPAALPSARCPALQPAPSFPAARASRCPALRPARRPALQLASRTALPCSPARRALLPCPARAPLSCASCPAAARASRPAAALRVALCCSAHHALLQPTRRALLPCASRPAAARALRSAAPRVAPYCSPRFPLCCPARRALLPCISRALLPCPPRALPCSPRRTLPCPAAPPSPAELRRPARAALPNPSRAALPRSPAPLSRPTATTAAATARATAAPGGGAARSAGGAVGARGAEGATGSAGGAGPTTDRHCLSWPLSRQLQRLVVDSSGRCLSWTTPPLSSFETFSLQLLSELVSQRCVTGSVEAAALGASESASPLGASESAAALGASESTAALGASEPADAPSASEFVAALGAHASTATANPTGGLVVTQASTVLPCPAVPSSPLSGLHLPISTNLASNAAIQDVWVDTFIPGGQRKAICQVDASSQVSASGQLAASCSCRVLSHQTLLWHHRLGHPSLLLLRSMHSRLLHAAPHSSEFPPTTSPLQTLHMDVWGPAPVGGTDQERYFLLVVDDYTRYTIVFPLRHKADVSGVLIPWIRATRRQLRERFRQDLPVLRLHSDRGGEFSSGLLEEFCRDEGIRKTFMLLTSPQKNGIAKRRLGLILERPRPHSDGRGKLAMHQCFGSGARSPLFAMPKQASSPLALSAASSLASPLTP